VKASLNRA